MSERVDAPLSGGEGSSSLTSVSEQDLDAGLVVNGQINVRKTHPGLYRLVMGIALICIALGVNFLVFTPTFRVYDLPNPLWGAIFLAVGLSKVVFLNLYRSLRLTRMTMAFAAAYILFFGAGTMQPALEGNASLQLPILYAGIAATLVALLLEPFINPWTAKRD